MRRDDGPGIFYRGQLNLLFSDPEHGKTWLLLCALAETLQDGGRGLFVDMDHNGAASTAARLLQLGVTADVLGDLDRFRYIEPDGPLELIQVVIDCTTWTPDLIGLDSLGELLPMFKASSNSGDDFTVTHTRVIKPLVRTGACVVLIDHLAKGAESRASGPTGSPAKRRAVGGVSLRVKAKDAFVPGQGGTAYVTINKDRHGGLRAKSPVGEREPLAAVFRLRPGPGDTLTWSLRPAKDGEHAPADSASADLVAKIAALRPPPSSGNDAHRRIGGQRQSALDAYKAWQTTQSCRVCRFPMTLDADLSAGIHESCKENDQ
ncbi:AAA family ATPase [Gordonia sp. NPDC003422]